MRRPEPAPYADRARGDQGRRRSHDGLRDRAPHLEREPPRAVGPNGPAGRQCRERDRGRRTGPGMANDELGRAHPERFRAVSNRYPRRVSEAYDGDLQAAASDDDATVAARVAGWEQAQGLPVPRGRPFQLPASCWRPRGRDCSRACAGLTRVPAITADGMGIGPPEPPTGRTLGGSFTCASERRFAYRRPRHMAGPAGRCRSHAGRCGRPPFARSHAGAVTTGSAAKTCGNGPTSAGYRRSRRTNLECVRVRVRSLG